MSRAIEIVAGQSLPKTITDRLGQSLELVNLVGTPDLPTWIEAIAGSGTVYFRPPAGAEGDYIVKGDARVKGSTCSAPFEYQVKVVAQAQCVAPQFTSALPAMKAKAGEPATGMFTATGTGPIVPRIDPVVPNLAVTEKSAGVFEVVYSPPAGSATMQTPLNYTVVLDGPCGNDPSRNGTYQVEAPDTCPAAEIADTDASFTASASVTAQQNWFLPVSNGPVEEVRLVGQPGFVTIGPIGSLGFTLAVASPTASQTPYKFKAQFRTRCGWFEKEVELTVNENCIPGSITGWPDVGDSTCANPTKTTFPESFDLVADGEWRGPYCVDNDFSVATDIDVDSIENVEVRQATTDDGAANNTQCVMLRSTVTNAGFFKFTIAKSGCSGDAFTVNGTLTNPGGGGGGGGGQCSGTPGLASGQGISIDMSQADSVTFGLTSGADSFEACFGMDPDAVNVSISADGMSMTVQVVDSSKLLTGDNGPYYCVAPKCGNNVGSAIAGGVSNAGSGGGGGGGGGSVDCANLYASGPGTMVANGTENLVVNGNFKDAAVTWMAAGVVVAVEQLNGNANVSYDAANDQTTIPLVASNSGGGDAQVTLTHTSDATCVHSFQVSTTKQLGEGGQ